MPIFRENPGANRFVPDAWGWIGRNDWEPVPGRTGLWHISGESPNPNDAIEDINSFGGFFGSADAAVQSLGPRPGRTNSENAYSASLAAQGIPESELPYNSGQLKTFLAQASRGLPVADYLQSWARTTPGAFGQIGQRMYDQKPAKLAEILKGREKDTEDARRKALVEYLMRMYGGQSGVGAV